MENPIHSPTDGRVSDIFVNAGDVVQSGMCSWWWNEILRKVLIANRGEIAIRVMWACRELNIETVAIYSNADKDALHVKYADEAFLVGEAPPSKSYLNIERIVDIAKNPGVKRSIRDTDSLPRITILRERCTDEGITFIGLPGGRSGQWDPRSRANR